MYSFQRKGFPNVHNYIWCTTGLYCRSTVFMLSINDLFCNIENKDCDMSADDSLVTYILTIVKDLAK